MRHLYIYVLFLFVSSSTYASVHSVQQMGESYHLTAPWGSQEPSELKFAQDDDEDFITPKQKKKIKGFWEKYFSFQTNDALVAEVRNNKWAFFAGGCLSCVGGTVWLPMLVIDEKPPANYTEEGLIAWGSHFILQMSMNAVSVALLSLSIPSPTTLVACADMVWWLPVNAMNVWDDGRKRKLSQIRLEKEFLASLEPVDEQNNIAMAY